MLKKIDIQTRFEELLQSRFPLLQPCNKWKQTMWHLEGNVVVSLIQLSKKTKLCFFNNPTIQLDKIQRWSASIYSHNLEYQNESQVDWERIDELIQNTIETQK